MNKIKIPRTGPRFKSYSAAASFALGAPVEAEVVRVEPLKGQIGGRHVKYRCPRCGAAITHTLLRSCGPREARKLFFAAIASAGHKCASSAPWQKEEAYGGDSL